MSKAVNLKSIKDFPIGSLCITTTNLVVNDGIVSSGQISLVLGKPNNPKSLNCVSVLILGQIIDMHVDYIKTIP